MKLRILSDLHLEEYDEDMIYFNQIYPNEKYDETLILAGDIGTFDSVLLGWFLSYVSDRFNYVIYVAGNHEYYCHNKNYIPSMDEINKELEYICSRYDNVYFLNNTSIEIEGITFAGCTLWTPFRDTRQKSAFYLINDKNYIYQSNNKKIDHEYIDHLHHNSVYFLQNLEKVDVIITHHLPHASLIKTDNLIKYADINPCYFSDQIELIKKQNPKLWICGHSHTRSDRKIGNTRFIINPIGYETEETGYDENLVIEI